MTLERRAGRGDSRPGDPAVSAADAIVAARRFADGHGDRAWRNGSERVSRVTMEGHDCWRVEADPLPPPGEPDWLMEFDHVEIFLIDVTTGACIGVGTMSGYHLFVRKKDDPAT